MDRFPECLHCFLSRHNNCEFVNLPTQSLYDVCPLYYPCSEAGTPGPVGPASGSDQDDFETIDILDLPF